MATLPQHAGCGCGSHANSSVHDPNCASCPPAQLGRNTYFTGKLLLDRDFQVEQDFFRESTCGTTATSTALASAVA